MAKQLPLTYTIPTPCEIPTGKGITSTRGPNGRLLQSRGTIQEWRRVQVAAHILDVTASNMLRCIVRDVAEQVIKAAKEQGIDVDSIYALYD